MAQPSINAALMNDLVARCQAGDRAARDDLVRLILHRMERLARRMLRQFPHVARYVEWEEVLSDATMKLLHALQTHRPACPREFFALAAAIVRNHLIDLARHFKQRIAREVVGGPDDSGILDPLQQHADPASVNPDLDRWTAFHEAVETLPPEEREMFSLIAYHDWSHDDVAALFQCSTKTVQRRYRDAVAALRERLGDEVEPLVG